MNPSWRPPPTGRRDSARDQKSVALLHKTATAQWATGRRVEAILTFQEIARLAPTSADAHHNLGSALFANGQLAEAATSLTIAVDLRPSFEAALIKLAGVMEQLGRETEAAVNYRRLARLIKDKTQTRLFLSKALTLEGDTEGAEAELRRALAASPDSKGAHALLGQLLLNTGAFQEGEAHLIEAMDAFPDVFQQVAAARRMTGADRPMLDRVSRVAALPELALLQRAAVYFGLGKAYDDLGDYAQAISCYDAANALRAGSARLDRRGLVEQYDRTIAAYTHSPSPPAVPLDDGQRLDFEAPILILGMPRSGTTLVEQILSSHPAVAAGGELPFWRDCVVRWSSAASVDMNILPGATPGADTLRGLINARPATSFVERVAREAQAPPISRRLAADQDQLAEAARDYTALLRRVGGKALRITDKAPFNFERIGLIRSALPGVRIIHCRRHPIDTCLSIFFTNYRGRQAWNRADLVFQYRQYERLMAHWRAILSPDRFIEVDYEAVVADRDREARRLIAFCDLPWDDACRAPEQNARVVKSASLWQVRQPIYVRSLDRWRNYEPWLGELKELTRN